MTVRDIHRMTTNAIESSSNMELGPIKFETVGSVTISYIIGGLSFNFHL